MGGWTKTGVSAGLAVGLLSATAVHAEIPERVRQLLEFRLGFSAPELNTVDRGHPVTRSIRLGDRREIAAAGVVRVDVPAAFFLQRFVDIVSFKQSPIVRQIGKFGDPPSVEDLAALTFEPADLEALQDCRVGDCDIQLSADQLRRVEADVDWSRPDAQDQANQVLRQLLVEYVLQYSTAGNQVLLEYANDRPPLKVSDEVRLLVGSSGQLLNGLPEFSGYILGTSGPIPGAEEFIYWSKEQFGLKPVVSITHVIVYQPRRPEVPDIVIASKQIYASRYMAGSLAITLGFEGGTEETPSFYMAYANRTRPRAFPPLIGGLVRRIAQGRTTDGLEGQLKTAKDRLEETYRQAETLER